MIVSTHFDAGQSGAFVIDGNEVTFDLRPGQVALNVLLLDVAEYLTIHLLFDQDGAAFVLPQGLLLSDDGVHFRAEPVQRTGEQRLSITVETHGRNLRVATRAVYGRDAVDQLLCDLHGHPRIRPRMLRRSHRSTLLFECGEDDGQRPIHYILAGEDVSEGPGSIVADHMLRLLAAGETDLLDRSVVRIIPVVSLYCAARPSGSSYNTLKGESIYGAATWGDPSPPPEFALIRELVEESVADRRLGCLLTIHSWFGQFNHTGLEFCTIGGEHVIPANRAAAALAVAERMVTNVPLGQAHQSGKCWHPGLARDYLLKKHNLITFRVEMTSIQNPANDYLPPARAFLHNMAAVEDWSFMYPPL